jgi:hypothetical protein
VVTRRKYRDGGKVVAQEPESVPDEGPAPAATTDNRRPAPASSDSPVADALRAIQKAERLQQEMAQPQPAPSFEAQISVLPRAAQDWVRDHPEFWTNKHKNKQLVGLHGYLTDTKGLAPFSREYFDRLESELGLSRTEPAPEPPKPAPIVQAPPRSVPYAAPVTRGAPNISAGGSVPTTITLSIEERDMARRSYQSMPPAEAERLYAEMKRRMLISKANGTIQS